MMPHWQPYTGVTMESMFFKRLLFMLCAMLAAIAAFAAPQATTPWNQQVRFDFVNGTNGQFADNQVHWAIVGRRWDKDGKHPFV
jgi:hypothetical protein